LIDFTLFELKIASAIFLSRRGDQIARDLVGGIFDLHGTANQNSKGSQKVELAKLLGIWKRWDLAHTQTLKNCNIPFIKTKSG